MGRITIACYKPKPGKEEDLLNLTQEHMPILRSLGLITDREAIVGRAGDGTIVEVFEWKSQEAIDEAHRNSTVHAMWERYDKVCDYVPVGSLEEAAQPFSGFEALELDLQERVTRSLSPSRSGLSPADR